MGQGLYKLASGKEFTKHVDEQNPYYRKFQKVKEELTGWDRLQMMFEISEYGDYSPELHRVTDSTLVAGILGAVAGGIGRSRIVRHDWIRKNLHVAFETPLIAKRQYTDTVALGFGSGAFRIGWRLAAFTGIYMLSSTCISVYRGKMGILDQTGGAALAGFIYKFRDGPKASISGAIFGAILGLIAGTISVASLKLLGVKDTDVLEWQYQQFEESSRRKLEKMKENRTLIIANKNPLMSYHDRIRQTNNLETILEEDEIVEKADTAKINNTSNSNSISNNKENLAQHTTSSSTSASESQSANLVLIKNTENIKNNQTNNNNVTT